MASDKEVTSAIHQSSDYTSVVPTEARARNRLDTTVLSVKEDFFAWKNNNNPFLVDIQDMLLKKDQDELTLLQS
jgi:hypothetical protein